MRPALTNKVSTYQPAYDPEININLSPKVLSLGPLIPNGLDATLWAEAMQ